jgi:hypothetical protein
MKTKGDTITLECTGRTIYANSGIIGISPNGGTYTGYDDDVAAETFTTEEQVEIANEMIQRWIEFRKMAQATLDVGR